MNRLILLLLLVPLSCNGMFQEVAEYEEEFFREITELPEEFLDKGAAVLVEDVSTPPVLRHGKPRVVSHDRTQDEPPTASDVEPLPERHDKLRMLSHALRRSSVQLSRQETLPSSQRNRQHTVASSVPALFKRKASSLGGYSRSVASTPLSGSPVLSHKSTSEREEEHIIALQDAAKKMNFDEMNRLVGECARREQWHVCLSDGRPLMFWAIEHDTIPLALLLIRHGVNAGSQDLEGRTSLMYSLDQEKDSFSHMFVEKGGLLTTSDNKGRTALHYAVDHELREALRELIRDMLSKNPTLIDMQDQEGSTPLMLAIRNGLSETAVLLLSHKADAVTRADITGNTALHYLAASHLAACDTLCSQVLYTEPADLNACNAQGATPLTIAFRHKNNRVILWLVAQGVHVSSLLHLAVREGYREFFELGLPYDCEEQDDRGLTPLFCAVEQEDVLFCQKLLAHGASADAADSKGNTPLHYAATNGNEELCTILLPHVSSLEQRNQDGESPLMCAVKAERFALVPFLIQQGADPQCIDTGGRSLIDVVEGKNFPLSFDVCASCHRHHGLTEESFICDVRQGRYANVSLHIQRNLLIVDATDGEGSPALLLAVSNGHLDVATLLVENHVSGEHKALARELAQKKGNKKFIDLFR